MGTNAPIEFPQPEVDLDWYTSRIKAGLNFTVARYGDGEWLAITGMGRGANVDQHQYFPAMGARMAQDLMQPWPTPPFMHVACVLNGDGLAARANAGPCPHGTDWICRGAIGWIQRHGIRIPFFQKHPINFAFERGELFPFIEVLRGRKIVYVGPAHLRDLSPKYFPVKRFVEIPLRNCFLELDRIHKETVDAVIETGADFIGLSCGMPANLLAYDLHGVFNGSSEEFCDVTIMDLGSIWDVLFDKCCRGRKLEKFKGLIAKNFGLEV